MVLLSASMAAGGSVFLLAAPAQAATTATVRTGDGALRVRAAASTGSAQVGSIANGSRPVLDCAVTGEYIRGAVRATDQWDRRSTGDFVSHAYIDSAPLPACSRTAGSSPRAAISGRVAAGGGWLRVRLGPNTRAAQVTSAADGSTVAIDCQVQGETISGTTGTSAWWDRTLSGLYVSHSYVRSAAVPRCSGSAAVRFPTDAQAQAAVSFARAQLGKRYVFGTQGPTTYDCSGLVMAAWRAAGVQIPRTTYDQATTGVAVSGTSAMRPGDLILIPGDGGSMSRPGHVGMYIGVGRDGSQQLIQASSTQTGVVISSVRSWLGQIAAIRRPTL